MINLKYIHSLEKESQKLQERLKNLKKFINDEHQKRKQFQQENLQMLMEEKQKPYKNMVKYKIFIPNPKAREIFQQIERKKNNSKIQILQKLNDIEPQPKEFVVKKKKTNEVQHFLQEIGMERYQEILIRNGFEDMDTLVEADENVLSSLDGAFSIPLGHKMKLLKKLEQ